MGFQENLIRARKLRGMTQEELAAKLNISRQAVSKWETGESLPQCQVMNSKMGKKITLLEEEGNANLNVAVILPLFFH